MTSAATIRELERRLAAAPSSPLFARLAHGLLAHGEVSRAETLCERGIELYPHYTTGRLIQARCLAARGRYADAIGALDAVAESYPGNVLLGMLGEEWRERAAAVGEADDDDRAVSVPAAEEPAPETPRGWEDSAAVTEHTEVLHGDAGEPPSPVPSNHPGGVVPILQPVPASLNRASFIEPDRIVSRTLAEIYASQGAIAEAVETYRILLERMPEGRDRWADRLRELEDRLGTDTGPRTMGEE